jgi:putative DNA primase/helicase
MYRRWDFGCVEAEVAEDAERSYTPEELARIANARKIWDSSKPIGNTLAETYLRRHRKLDPFDTAGRVLRFHVKCPWRNEDTGVTEFLPALIAAFRTIADGEIVAIHRIALREDGGKIGRRMLGPVRGVAIMLDALDDSSRLAIAEGVETALAARQIGAAKAPVWALGSTGGISRFPAIEAVHELTIIGERDEASIKAMRICGQVWRRAGKAVRVVLPDPPHSDFNDVLIAEAA